VVLVTIFLTSLVMGFSGAIMPGPLLTVTINESLRRGAKAGPQIASGHALLELILVIAIFFGLGTFITLAWVKGTIGVIGGLFLFWMALGILRDAFSLVSLDLLGQDTGKQMHPWVAGATVSSSNPYWFVWWATAGAGSLMLSSSYGLAGASSFYLWHISSDYIWYSLVSVAVARGKSLIRPAVYRIILGMCGLFLVGMASYFVYSGISFFRLI
jgi:threonine/homoserine/homoserine lactone efflux protein